MRKNFLNVFLIVGFLVILNVISADAQSNLSGKYNYKDTITEGNPMDSSLEIKDKSVVVFTYISTEDDYETKERPGTWSYNKAKNLLTVMLPAITDNENKGDDKKQMYIFKLVGGNLKFVKSSYEDNLVGKVYKRL